MSQIQKKVCVVLAYPPSYSETFLQCHVENLSAAVNYLERFPINVDVANSNEVSYESYGKLVQTLKSTVKYYLLNPAKSLYIRNFFRANHINVVLAEYGESGVGVLGICKQLQIPLVVHFHGSDAYSSEILDRNREAYKKMFGYASAIISVSRHMTEQLVRLGAPRNKVVYNPYGVEVDKFKQLSGPKLAKQVIAVGRFVEKKAPYLTILAFKKALERVPGANLVMIGHGTLHDVCHQIIRSLRIEHAVELKGIMPHEEIGRLMRQSAVFVQHSLVPESGDTEGTPVAVLEASASALPVVSTRHAGINDAVVHGKTGFLVAEGDIDGMSHYICQLLTDPKRAQEIGKHGQEHIAANFNLAGSVERLKNILDNAVAEKAKEIIDPLSPIQYASSSRD